MASMGQNTTSTTYKYEASQPPTMGSTTGGVAGKGSFVARRCTSGELAEIPNIAELRDWACRHSLAPSLEAFVNLGAEDDESLEANRLGFSQWALRPRVLTDVSNVQTSTTILQGRVSLSLPVCVAPFAGCRAIHPDGESAVAQAAAQVGTVYTVPNWASTPVADLVQVHFDSTATAPVGAAPPLPLFFQIYPHKPTQKNDEGIDRNHLAALLRYLASLGRIVAVIVTCDTVNNGNREKTYKNQQWVADLNQQVGGFPEPCALPREGGVLPPISEPGHSSSMTWKDIRWMRTQCQKYHLGLILKGIMTKEDTKRAVQAGVDAIIVSNHGGRQLDGTMGTVQVLQECVEMAAGSSLEVFVDGGIRRGKDIAKCLALGAKCVFVERPVLWGLAVGGQEGVVRALTILRGEFYTVLQLLGCENPQQLSRDHVQDRSGSRAARPDLFGEQTKLHWLMGTVFVTVAAFALGRASKAS